MIIKLQLVINHMDKYRILKETFLAWKGGILKEHVLYWLEYQSVIFIVLDDCHISNFAVQDLNYDVSLCVSGRSQTLISTYRSCVCFSIK